MNAELAAFLEAYCGLPPEEAIRKLKARGALWSSQAAEAIEGHMRRPTPIILPKKRGDRMTWYALGFDDSQARELREQLLAFIGPTYSDFTGRSAEMAPEDSLERAIHGLAPNRVFRLSSTDGSQLLLKMEGLLKLRAGREFRRAAMTKSVGAMISDFERALTVGNLSEARQLLQTLDTQGLLDAQNVKFLEIKLYADTEQWGALLQLRLLDAVIMVRRPLAVTQAIVQAIYHVHLAGRSLDEQVRRMAMAVLPRFRPVFVALGSLRNPDVLRAFMVAAVADGRRELRSQLLDVGGSIRDELGALGAGLSDPDDVATGAEAVQAAMSIGNVERAEIAVEAMEAGIELAQARLELFAITMLPEHAVEAIRVVERLPNGAYHDLVRNSRYEGLLAIALEGPPPTEPSALVSPPSSWPEWFMAVAESRIANASAIALADDGSVSWPIADLVAELNAFDVALNDILGHDKAQETLYRAFPSILRAIMEEDDFPRRSMAPVYQRLLDSLTLYLFRRNRDDLEAALVLLRAVMASGVDAKGYDHLLENSRMILDEGLAPQTLAQCLDIAGEFIISPCPASARSMRDAVLHEFATKAIQYRSEVGDRDDDALLRHFLAQSGFEDLLRTMPVPAPSSDDPLHELSGTIAVYTLSEGVATACRTVLKELCPRATIVTNSEHDASKTLGDLARNADIFVMVTWSAKHAATTFITDKRRDRTLLRPDGKGISSIVRALRCHAESS